MNKTYRLFAAFAIYAMAFNFAKGQNIAGTGKPIGEIYADFHTRLNESSATTGFDINRAFLGYQYFLDNNFSAKVVINAGNPDDIGTGTVKRRYNHLRDASLTWTNENLTIFFGLTETRIFGTQQRWWGKRYLAIDIQSRNGYGFVSDLGVVMDYKFNDVFSGDVAIMNGKGFSESQFDNNVRSSLGLTITPNQNFMFRVYGDHYRVQDQNQFTGVAFAGYRNKYFYIGADCSFKSYGDNSATWAVSTLNGIYLTEKNELFFRYDYAASLGAKGETTRWDMRDGTFTIIGLQHTFTPNVRLTLNYQGTKPYFSGMENRHLMYVNAHFRF